MASIGRRGFVKGATAGALAFVVGGVEVIMAAHEAFLGGGTNDFRLHRLDRINQEIKVATYDQDALATSVDMAHEVR